MQLTPENAERSVVFVTAASSNHFTESILAISRVQSMRPKQTMTYYDIGLSPQQVKTVSIPNVLCFLTKSSSKGSGFLSSSILGEGDVQC